MEENRKQRKKYIADFSLVKAGKKPKKKRMKRIEIYLLIVASAIVLGYAFIAFMFQTVKVVGPSMQGTLRDGDVIVISKIGKMFGIDRNDVVAIKQPENDYYSIKRVVAKPGDTVQIIGGKLYVNEKLQEKFADKIIINSGIASELIKLDQNQYFVLGDNVNSSDDSRFKNMDIVQKTDIKGIAIYRLSPEKGRIR
ncbi:MAG: signal peptidase I [Eubacterium sp.]|nr:signal peptidase I [Eubacterium sp.]SEF41899.1 signal peptidase I [Eubacterium ruminantium]